MSVSYCVQPPEPVALSCRTPPQQPGSVQCGVQTTAASAAVAAGRERAIGVPGAVHREPAACPPASLHDCAIRPLRKSDF